MELQLGLPWQHMDTESGKKVAIGRCCALPGYYSKVTLRSSPGPWKVKLAKTCLLGFFIDSKPIWAQISITNDCCWYIIGRVPFHHASQGVCMKFQPWRVISALVFPLSHLFPKAGVNQQNYWNVAVWNRSLSPYGNISMDTGWLWKVAWTGVVLYLGYHLKVIRRSNWWNIFFCFLSIPSPFGVKVSFTNDCCWHIFGRVPFHHESPTCNFSLGRWLPPWYSPYHTHFPKLEWINTSTKT